VNQRVINSKCNKGLQKAVSIPSLQTKLELRKVVSDDITLLYEWANEPEIRSRSFNTATIPMEVHANWFIGKLNNPHSLLYVAEVLGKPAAHIRFEIYDHTAIISYLIDKEFRGKGLSHALLLMGLEKLINERKDIITVAGLVQQDNIASIRAFEKAGFSLSTPDPRYAGAQKFVLQVQ
jgi:UDP-2,4-diacetamido-2,4,6-trideoxy-beta-L-altropyranose hydrolase